MSLGARLGMQSQTQRYLRLSIIVVQNTANSSGFSGDGRGLRSCCLLTETGANAYFISLLQEFFRS